MYANWTAQDLEQFETLAKGHTCNLKYDRGDTRIWLSRCGLEDGMPFRNTVTVEKMIDGAWETVEMYAG